MAEVPEDVAGDDEGKVGRNGIADLTRDLGLGSTRLEAAWKCLKQGCLEVGDGPISLRV